MNELIRIDRRIPGSEGRILPRQAVRAIIQRDGKLALVRSLSHGELKFPGGGMEPGEDRTTTLIREVREETGLTVIPSSIKILGYAREFRPFSGGEVLDQTSWYCRCEVEDRIGAQDLDDYEAQRGYHLVWLDPRAALDQSRAAAAGDWLHTHPWTERETRILEMICQGRL